MKGIIEEIKNVILKNSIFYDNSEIKFNAEFTGYSLYRQYSNRDLIIVSDSLMHVNSKLKNCILQ